MGSAAAWQLSRRGLSVLGLDRLHPPHTMGSSHGGSRVIREMAFEHPRYVPMVRRSYELWAELAAASGRELILPTGAIYIGAPDSLIVAGSRRSAVEHGVDCEEYSAAEVRRRWPQFHPDAGMVGLFERRAGVLLPETCIEAALAQAAAHGATLRYGEALVSWEAGPDGVRVSTDRVSYSADRLVLALGPWMQGELARLGVSVWIERVVQQWFAPVDAAAMDPSRCPVFLWEDADGVVFYGFPMMDGAVKAAVHHRGAATTADTVRREVSPEDVARVATYLKRWMPAAAGPHLRSAVCVYTNTTDGNFIVDRHPEHPAVLLASPCSGIGFKFAPVIGEMLADLAMGLATGIDLAAFQLKAES